MLAMADAFKIAKGFLPVSELLDPLPLTRFEVPDVLVVLEIPLGYALLPVVEEAPPLPLELRALASRRALAPPATLRASALNYSMLYSDSLSFSFVHVLIELSQSLIRVKIRFLAPAAY